MRKIETQGLSPSTLPMKLVLKSFPDPICESRPIRSSLLGDAMDIETQCQNEEQNLESIRRNSEVQKSIPVIHTSAMHDSQRSRADSSGPEFVFSHSCCSINYLFQCSLPVNVSGERSREWVSSGGIWCLSLNQRDHRS